MKHVLIDEETRVVQWDDYFKYLESVRAAFTEELYSYVSDWSNYSLDSKTSLHDAWLMGVHFGLQEREITIEWLSAHQDRKLILRYCGVESYNVDLSVGYRKGDRDVLAHEFRVSDKSIVHEIAFNSRNRIVIVFQTAIPTVEVLQ